MNCWENFSIAASLLSIAISIYANLIAAEAVRRSDENRRERQKATESRAIDGGRSASLHPSRPM